MYKLYRQPNGTIKQVAENQPQEDQFPNPLQAKGEESVAPFVIQEKNQFNLIKENETQQARFQTAKLQNSNYQIINFRIKPTDSTDSQAFFFSDYNGATAVGSALDSGVMFGTNTADVTKAKYFNIVYANIRLGENYNSTANNILLQPSYVEFYLMEKIPTGDFGGKIPRQIESVVNQTGVSAISNSGTINGVQSFGIDVYNENAYYTQTPDLKGMRTIGVALKRIALNFESAVSDISEIRLDVEIGVDLNTEGNNY